MKSITLIKSIKYKRHSGLVLALIPLVLILGFFLWKSLQFNINDFGNYYFGGAFLSQNIFDNQIYFPHHFLSQIQLLTNEIYFLSYAPNSPFLAMLFMPLSHIKIADAKLIFNIISIAAFVIALVQLFNHLNVSKYWLIAVPIIFLVPFKNQILFGQLYFLLFAFLTFGYLNFKKENQTKTALWWGIAICLKIFPAILFGFLIFQGRFKTLLYLVISVFLIILFTSYFSGIEAWIFFITEVLARSNSGEIAGAFVDNYQSAFMFLKRIFVQNPVSNPNGLTESFILFDFLFFNYKILILAITAFIHLRNSNTFLSFSLWILSALLILPYCSTYSLLLLIYVFLVIVQLQIKFSIKAFLIFILASALNLGFYKEYPFPINYARLFLLLGIFSYFVFLFRNSLSRLPILLGTFAISLISLIPKNIDKSVPFLHTKTPLITYDYQLDTNGIDYYFWNQYGPQKTNIPMSLANNLVPEPRIINQQIFLGDKQLTFDHSNKLKPRWLNKNEIIFLSDKERGIGFYQLRKINIEQ